LARQIVDLISDKQGADILMLDTHALSSISDFFVIATCDNDRQTQAVADEIQKQFKKQSILPLHVEGTPDSGWLLLDYNGVIVHLFSPAMRDFYRLEKLWDQAPMVVRMQ